MNTEQSLAEAQTDMDFRYDSAAEVRQMGAGPGVLPARQSAPAATRSAKAVNSTVPTPATSTRSRKLGRPGSVFSRRR